MTLLVTWCYAFNLASAIACRTYAFQRNIIGNAFYSTFTNSCHVFTFSDVFILSEHFFFFYGVLCCDFRQLLGLRYRLIPEPQGEYGHLAPDLTWNGMIRQLIDRVSNAFRARRSDAFDLPQ